MMTPAVTKRPSASAQAAATLMSTPDEGQHVRVDAQADAERDDQAQRRTWQADSPMKPW